LIYGNHILLPKLLSRKRRKRLKKVKRGGLIEQSIILYEQHKQPTHEPMHNTRVVVSLSLQQRTNYTIHSSLTHTHESNVLANIFNTLGDTVCNTVWKLYISLLHLYLYIYIRKPYLYDLNISRGTIASFLATEKKMESLSRIMTCMKSL